MPFFGPRFGNPVEHAPLGARGAHRARRGARARRAMSRRPADEICFTSGGTEADNIAILGAWRARRGEGRNAVVTTPIEHKAVLGAVHQAAREGADERFCRDDARRRRRRDVVRRARRRRHRDRVGDVGQQRDRHDSADRRAGAARRRASGALFHTDAVQAFGKVDDRRADDPVRLRSPSPATRSARPRASARCSFAAARSIEPLFHGGSQDRGRRPGTENVAAVDRLRARRGAGGRRARGGVDATRAAARSARGGDSRARFPTP